MAILFGIIFGLISAAAIAYMIVGIQAKKSNVKGDSMGGFQNFSDKPMQYIRKEGSRKISYEEWLKRNHYV
ncbi:MAG TPA: hypothetical protein PLZ77_04550 [Lachnospiraceae bacterium]|nr:hypothetical protein [Lachnospiraceae bacterium]HPF29361.1 hypothetical protein [Lachnospiraceae bacterium]